MTQETEKTGTNEIDEFLNESAEAVSDKLLRSFVDNIVGTQAEEEQPVRKKEKREKATFKYNEQQLNRLKRRKIDTKQPVGKMLDQAIQQFLEQELSGDDVEKLKSPGKEINWVDGNYTFSAQHLKRLKIFCTKRKLPIYLALADAIRRFLNPTSQTGDPEPGIDLTSGFDNL